MSAQIPIEIGAHILELLLETGPGALEAIGNARLLSRPMDLEGRRVMLHGFSSESISKHLTFFKAISEDPELLECVRHYRFTFPLIDAVYQGEFMAVVELLQKCIPQMARLVKLVIDAGASTSLFSEMFLLSVPNLPQLRHFAYAIWHAEDVKALVEIVKKHPKLTRLSLTCDNPLEPAERSAFSPIVDYIANLRTMSANTSLLAVLLSKGPLPMLTRVRWRQPRNYTASQDDIQRVASCIKEIEYLFLDNGVPDAGELNALWSMSFPSLIILKLGTFRGSQGLELFHKDQFPSLSTLVLEKSSDLAFSDSDAVDFTNEIVNKAFQRLPQLQSVIIRDMRLGDEKKTLLRFTNPGGADPVRWIAVDDEQYEF